MAIDYKAIGQNIQGYRKFMDLTQEELAEGLSISVSYISQIERGNTRPSLEMLSQIAAKLECTISDLLPPDQKSNSSEKESEPEPEPTSISELLDKSLKILSNENITSKSYISLINRYFSQLDIREQQMICYWVVTNGIYQK